jgi:N-acylneuraminate cytidylyltransferase
MSGNVALIPARGGSKRVPRKNIRDFCGKPMIAWPIEAALQSGVFDEVIVSTDDGEIAEVACACGATVPFIRPAGIANDHAGLTVVVRHAINWLRGQDRAPDLVACIYATAAFVRREDLRAAARLLESRPDADYVSAVATFPSAVQRAFTTSGQGWLEFLWPEFAETRSQDLRPAFHDAGLFFIGRPEPFLKYPTSISGKTLAFEVPRLLCQDIDTPEDWDHAAALFEYLQSRKGGGHR